MQSRPIDWRFTGFRLEYDVRDRAMADLARIALEREGPEGRVFLWAHNAHVSRALHRDNRMTMCRYLTDDLGSGYVSIGFGFHRGSFQALPPVNPAKPEELRTLTEMTVGGPPDSYAEAVMQRGPSPIWVADLRMLEPGTPAHGWFWLRHAWRWTGALYSDELEAKHEPISIAQSHDLLFFVEQTTRARPLPNTIKRMGIKRDW
jgi:erythromycin esterase